VALIAVAATALAAEAPEAKRKVTFSDSKGDEPRVDVAIPTPMFQRNSEASRRAGSSLDGVGAAPFAPLPNLLPGGMSRRELESRDARSKWILDTGKSLAITEENANRAFGVRSADVEWSGKESERPTGFWGAYFGKKDDQDPSRSPSLIEPPFKDRSGLDPLRRFQPVGMPESDQSLIPTPDRQRLGVLFSDSPSQTPAFGVLADAIEETRRDLVRDHLNLHFNPTSPETRAETAAAARAEQFRRILGAEAPARSEPGNLPSQGAAALAETGAGQSPRGSIDLMGVGPDPTRRELNPVVARPAPDLGGGAQLGFTEPFSRLSPTARAPRHPVIDMSPVRMPQPADASADLGSANSRRRTIYSPTTLDMPRRSF